MPFFPEYHSRKLIPGMHIFRGAHPRNATFQGGIALDRSFSGKLSPGMQLFREAPPPECNMSRNVSLRNVCQGYSIPEWNSYRVSLGIHLSVEGTHLGCGMHLFTEYFDLQCKPSQYTILYTVLSKLSSCSWFLCRSISMDNWLITVQNRIPGLFLVHCRVLCISIACPSNFAAVYYRYIVGSATFRGRMNPCTGLPATCPVSDGDP